MHCLFWLRIIPSPSFCMCVLISSVHSLPCDVIRVSMGQVILCAPCLPSQFCCIWPQHATIPCPSPSLCVHSAFHCEMHICLPIQAIVTLLVTVYMPVLPVVLFLPYNLWSFNSPSYWPFVTFLLYSAFLLLLAFC